MTQEELQAIRERKHQEVAMVNGRIIVTEEGIVFTGQTPILTDPVHALRDALDEVERLRGVLVKCLSANPSEIESIITQALGQEADPIDPRD